MPQRPTDPHPEDEEHYHDKERPGGADPKPRHQDVNSYTNDGKAKEKPANVESEGPKNAG